MELKLFHLDHRLYADTYDCVAINFNPSRLFTTESILVHIGRYHNFIFAKSDQRFSATFERRSALAERMARYYFTDALDYAWFAKT